MKNLSKTQGFHYPLIFKKSPWPGGGWYNHLVVLSKNDNIWTNLYENGSKKFLGIANPHGPPPTPLGANKRKK